MSRIKSETKRAELWKVIALVQQAIFGLLIGIAIGYGLFI